MILTCIHGYLNLFVFLDNFSRSSNKLKCVARPQLILHDSYKRRIPCGIIPLISPHIFSLSYALEKLLSLTRVAEEGGCRFLVRAALTWVDLATGGEIGLR